MRNRRLVLIIAILLAAAAVRLLGITAQSIWFDEGWSAYAAAQPSLLGAWEADATNPPLYYVLLNVAARGFGTSEFGLRYFSLLLGVLTIPLVCQLARRLAGERAGVYSALLACASAPLWWAAQEARMYTLLALLIVICALAWERVVTKTTRAAWIALWLGELALLYAHNTGPVVAIWLNLATFLLWSVRRRLGWKFWRIWIVGQIGIGLLWLPYFLSRYLLLQAANSAVASAPQIGLPLLGQVWQGLWVAPWALALSGLPLLALLSLLVSLVTVFLIVMVALGRRRALWLVVHVAVLIIGLVVGLMALGNDLHGRYLVMIVPLLLAVLGAGLAKLRRRGLRYAAVTPFLLLFVVDLIAANNPDYQHDDVRWMVQSYADRLSAGDSVIAWSYADRYDLAYYWDRLGVQARRVTLPEGADLDAVLPLLPTSGDVALNIWYTQRADYRGMMGCLLGNGTVNFPEVYFQYGMATQLYRDPVLAPPQFQPADFTFTDSGANAVARVDAFGRMSPATADRARCLPLRITLLREIDSNLKATLIVQNDLGWTIASVDAIFATANQRTSSSLAPGEALTAYPLLRLPYGAPPGDYRVFLRIYDETAYPSGYNPPQAGETVAGRDLLLATWSALPGADWSQVERSSGMLNLAMSGDLTLLDRTLSPAPPAVTSGEEIHAALLWQGAGSLPDLELADEAGAWRVSAATRLDDHDDITLDWRSLRVPSDAPTGSAVLRLGGWAVLARYSVEAQSRLDEPPPFETLVGGVFPGVGGLIGYTLSDPPFSRDNLPEITLVWRAGEQADAVDYTATVQLIDAAGRVIAQNDDVPGSRPTTGWRAGEYIVDSRTLAFNDTAVSGEATLIVALYDPATGTRVQLGDGTDALVLATGIAVE